MTYYMCILLKFLDHEIVLFVCWGGREGGGAICGKLDALVDW